jgi:hypothetical protein
MPRDEFNQAVKRTLAHRVGLHCSNPDCRAKTTGPQNDPVKVLNVGVAAHITAATKGGPRFDFTLSDKQRRSATNGIWLCQNCAKLVDSDLDRFTVGLLVEWKAGAESEARNSLGKTRRKETRSHHKAAAALKRDHAMRDKLTRDLLKPVQERMNLPRGSRRWEKFAYSEIIVHRIDDATYPDIDDSPGISGWFKLEVFDFYHGGINFILRIDEGLHDTQSAKWCLLTRDQIERPYPPRFERKNVLMTGKIPWRNILHYDMNGDEFYPMPHLYCAFADDGMPYEDWGYYLTGPGYQYELKPDAKLELEALLMEPEDGIEKPINH